MNAVDLEQLVLRHIRRDDYRPVKPRVMAQQFGFPEHQHAELKKVVKQLAKTGQLSYAANHLVQPAQGSRGDEVLGTFRRHLSGYGFVRPLGTRKSAGRDDDLFIPAHKTRDAASGDLVRVKANVRGHRVAAGGAAARSWKSSSGRTANSSAPISRKPAWAWSRWTAVTSRCRSWSATQRTGRASATKSCSKWSGYPTALRRGEGVITEVLGDEVDPGVDTLTILRQFQGPEEFPADVLEDARAQAQAFDGSIGDGRLDLTHLTVITIDPEDARDFDDAISLERLPEGHWRLGVHIADVSHFVRPRTALDRKARDRGTSVYLPDRVIPMLPEVISNHLASLQPDQVRYLKTAFIEYTPDGARVATDFSAAAIRSQRRIQL